VRIIHLARKPLEGSVADSVLEHGTGALNVDVSRIGFQGDADKWVAGSGGPVYRAYMDGSGQEYKKDHHEPTQNTAKPHDGGRWPANLILHHLPGCRCEGTKKALSGGLREGASNTIGSRPDATYADEGGLETVANWVCAPGCPVADLDRQGGHSTTGHRSAKSQEAVVSNTTFGTNNHQSREYPGESGGASRFFKQVRTDP